MPRRTRPAELSTRLKQHTAPRASITCHTHACFSRRVHVDQGDRGVMLNAVCVFLKSHFISHRTLLDTPFSSLFRCIILDICTWFVYLSLAAIPVDESIHCHSASTVMLLADWLNNPLSRELRSGDSLVSDGACKHCTNHAHMSHFRTRDFFSRVSRLESSRQQVTFVSR